MNIYFFNSAPVTVLFIFMLLQKEKYFIEKKEKYLFK